MENIVEKWIQADLDIADLTLEVIAELPKYLDAIEKAVNSSDINQIFKESHRLKGLSGNYHIEEVYVLSGNMAKESKKDNPDLKEIRRLFNDLKELINKIPNKYFDK